VKHNLLVSAGVAAVVAAVVTILLSFTPFPFGKPTPPKPHNHKLECLTACMDQYDKCRFACREEFETSDPIDADYAGWWVCGNDCAETAVTCREYCNSLPF